jgi:nucleoside-diphosphate-sugar epimerase
MLRIARKSTRDVLITGGAGFLGAHLASHFLANTDARISLFDDLAEPGAKQNLAWLNAQAGAGRLKLVRGDLRDSSRVVAAASSADEIYHVAQRRYLDDDPRSSQDAIKIGNSNLGEAALHSGRHPIVICASIGNEFKSVSLPDGTGSARLSPANADCLFQNFARFHNLPAVALLIDTVTGPRQFGEGQDWVARLQYAILGDRPCSIPSGDLSQIHNVLHVSDAIQAILAARAYIGKTAGNTYSLNSGCAHSITIEEMIHLIQRICYRRAEIVAREATDGCAQPCSEDRSFLIDTSWRARKSLEEIVRDIAAFWHANQQIIANRPRIRRIPARLSRVQAA